MLFKHPSAADGFCRVVCSVTLSTRNGTVFDEVSVGIVDLAAQHNSKDWSPIAELTNEKLSLGEIVFLAESSEERSCRIGAMRPKQRDVKNQLCLDIYCSI